MVLENSIFTLTEIGFDYMFTDEFWKISRRQQSVLLILYACFISEQSEFGIESVMNIMNKKNLLKISDLEFKKICNELKDNKELCRDFLNIEFN